MSESERGSQSQKEAYQNQYEYSDKNQPPRGAEVQRELEDQLRQFGVTMSDAFRHGFEGRGQEIGDRAWGVGQAVVGAVNYGIAEAGRAVEQAKETAKAASAEEDGFYGAVNRGAAAVGAALRGKGKNVLHKAARETFAVGLPLAIVGGVFTFSFGLAGAICLGTRGLFPAGTTERTVLSIVGVCLLAAALGFGWMLRCGAARLRASGQMKACADAAEALGSEQGVPLAALSSALQRPEKQLDQELGKWLRKGWLTAWLDEDAGRLYLTAESYRTARQETTKQAAEAGRAPNAPNAPNAQNNTGAQTAANANAANAASAETPSVLETARRFAAVLEQEQIIMDDAQAAEELAHMHTTVEAIRDWLAAHPESQPKARRFEEYYIPTTLKLLHTYNDVQGQQGENAATIRRDIAGILHTLNTAYDNLYDKLLSDTALDISGEIAALQGMLASDGLTGEGLQ